MLITRSLREVTSYFNKDSILSSSYSDHTGGRILVLRMQIFGEALLKYDIERPAENVNISNWWYLAKAYLPCCCWRLACWLAGSDRSWWISKKNFSSLSIHGLSLESQRRRCLKHCKDWECSPATLRWRVTIDACWDCCSQLSSIFTKGPKSRNVFVIVIIIVVVCICG